MKVKNEKLESLLPLKVSLNYIFWWSHSFGGVCFSSDSVTTEIQKANSQPGSSYWPFSSKSSLLTFPIKTSENPWIFYTFRKDQRGALERNGFLTLLL